LPDDEQNDADDKFRPEAIAARLDKLGQASDEEKLAEAEERKLNQRRTETKSGLELAASRRLAKIGEQAVKRPTAAGITVQDPFTARVASLGGWMQKHKETTASVVAMAVLGIGVVFGWMFWQDRRTAQASALLGTALADENGPIVKGDDDSADVNTVTGAVYPTFKSEEDRRQAALESLRKLESKYSGTGAAIVARLSEASLLLDAKDGKGALAAYEDVKSSALGKADPEVQGRAFEGIGFAEELLATEDAPNHDKHLDDAMTAYRGVEAVDVDGFKELGMYHRARLLLAKGDKSQALDVLKDADKRVSEAGENRPFPYLRPALEDAMKSIDPSAVPSHPAKGTGAGPNGTDMSDAKIQELIRQLQDQQKSKAPAGSTP
jgi:hypothetical protein